MGLRFRKSVTLCKGVKLNFGKTGMSVSVGGKGYHKTINTKGQVTTSVGIPGSGIYYTDTKRLGGNRQANTQKTFKINIILRMQLENLSQLWNMKSMIVLNPI